MKWFYILAAVIVVAMTLTPYWLLGNEGGQSIHSVVTRYAPDGTPVINSSPVVAYDSYSSAVRSIDPTTCGDTTSSGIQGNIYDGLYDYHYLLRPPTVIPSLAEAMPTISKDRLTYTIPLKKGVLFHRNPCFGVMDNGTNKTREVVANDFVLAIKRVADYHNENTGLSWAFLSSRIAGLDEYRQKTRTFATGDFSRYDLAVSGVRAIDDHTLELKLNEPFPQFIYVLAMHSYAPCPREAMDFWLTRKSTNPDDPGSQTREPIPAEQRHAEFRKDYMAVGTGAYCLDTYKRKQKIILVRNPDFRKELYPDKGMPGDKEKGLLRDAGKRVPFVDALVMEYTAEATASWWRFLSRQTDASGIPKETFESVITPGKSLTDQWRKKHIYLKTYSSPAIYWIAFNMEDPILGASKSLREAMCLCYDVENHIKILFNGRGKRAVNIVPSSFPTWKAAGPGPSYKFDLDAARKKIEQAKSDLAAKGLLEPDGSIPPITLDFGSRDENAQRFGEFAKQQFSKIGITLKVTLNDWPSLQKKVHNKATQCYTMGWHADYPDAENFLQLFYSPNIKKGTNDTNYTNPTFDALYEKARVMSDGPERLALYVKMIRMISDDVPVLLLTEPLSFVLYYDWNHNIKRHPIGYGYLKYRRIDTALREKLGGRD